MITYFYERMTDQLHHHWTPGYNRSMLNFAQLASRGFLVFIPDIPYRIGYPGESAQNAIISGVTALLDKGFVDKDNLGVQGHSWGGYQIAYLVTKTNIFKCAESGAPVVNMVSAYGGIRWESGMSRMFQYEHTQSRIGGTLWEKPLRYLENSPIFFIDKVSTPLLIMANDKDGAVPWYQGIEFYMGLRRLGKPAWLLNYNEEGHGLVKLQNRKDFQLRMLQFFEHYLKGAPKPVWMEKGVAAIEKGVK
jgi:dipeptidyl aminopeptidase/acylaminoacyl peptidase